MLILLTSLPIAYYAATYGVDIDLLTRGAGFGYLGSTITSLIYASFTFLFFAIEAAIMSLAFEMCFGIPLFFGYVLSSLIVIPLVTHGITFISRFQFWTQPVWIVLHLMPFVLHRRRRQRIVRALDEFLGPRRRRRTIVRSRAVRHRRDGGVLADRANRRAGRLPALSAGARRDRQARLGGSPIWRPVPAGSFPAC